ncbi:MAG: hypothetical protein M5U31_16385 [Acidimicrobiia bacterium]|nr:hypothetical protein [Acidimicrobiia bacterium]
MESNVGRYSSVLLYNGRPHVFYWDQNSGGLRHAYDNGQFWAFETLDRQLADPDIPPPA